MADDPKTCCYQSTPSRKGGQEHCPFMGEPDMEYRLVEVGGLTFCPYHLPYSSTALKADYNAEEEADHPELKQNWTRQRIDAFNSDISGRLDTAFKKEGIWHLAGTVFPWAVNFANRGMPAVNFADCHFARGHADFSGAEFSGGRANFTGARFSGGDVDFSRAHFSGGSAYFADAKFSRGDVSFDHAQFSRGYATFRRAQFSGGDISFDHAQFSGGPADFSTDPAAIKDDPSATAFKWVDFTHTTFSSHANFANRIFSDRTDFSGAEFGGAPEFHGCTLHQDTTFPPIESFKDTESDRAAHAYRTLRLAVKQQEAHEEEAMFWALEQRSKRNSLEPKQPKNWLPWSLSWGYDLLSNYGLNAGLPARWLGGWVIYSTMIYACVAGSLEKLASVDHWLDALGFSIAQMARPFFIWGDYDGADIKAALGTDEFSFLIKMLATVDSIVSLTLIALFILAVRRRFRMQ